MVETSRIRADGGAGGGVVRALRAALVRRPDSRERAWIERIEAQRQAMLTSVQPLRFEDFGSGDDTDVALTREASLREVPLGEMTRRSSSSPRWGYFLFRLARELRPDRALELGACVGVSAAYLSAAMELNGQGHLTTLEGGAALADRTRHTLSELGLTERCDVVQGPFAATLEGVLERPGQVDLAFIDGHHQEEPTLAYAEQVLPHVGSEAVLVFDDINWSAGMRRAWDAIVSDPRYAMTADLGGLGIAALSATTTPLRGARLHFG